MPDDRIFVIGGSNNDNQQTSGLNCHKSMATLKSNHYVEVATFPENH